MKQRRQQQMSWKALVGLPDLPEDVDEEILLRLPPESLILACKRVCRLWYNLINRPSFVDKYLRFNIQKTTTLRYNSNSSVSLFLKWTLQELSLHEIFVSHLRVCNHHQNHLSKQVLSLTTISTSTDDNAGGDLLPCVIQPVSLSPFVVE
ncbi:F-box domain containing protein [Trema orientale]|uniref:F-box domain containing protein n=1 Tax=Trema orientale TaxID=63057 RepID=A0A2P5BP72_TREOI|nr:F-box domain containing protein [Trema orientale]